MTIEQINHFLAIIKNNNFTRAADELFLHPSTISKSISSLEEELGGPLFVRIKGAPVLTESGRLLANEAPELLSRFKSMGERARKLSAGYGGNLSVISANGILPILLPYFKKFNEENPNVVWSSYEPSFGGDALLLESILNNKADMGLFPLGALPLDASIIESVPIYSCRFVLVVDKQHPFAGRSSVTLSDLSGLRVLMCKALKPDIVFQISSLIVRSGYAPLNLVNVDMLPDSETTLEFSFLQAAAGVASIICPEIVALGGGRDCVALNIDGLDPERDIFKIQLIWRRANTNPALQRFINVVLGSV